MKWDLDDLVAASDIADLFARGKSAVSNWVDRYPDFPQPVVVVARGMTKLWSRKAVLDWHARHDWTHEGPHSKAR